MTSLSTAADLGKVPQSQVAALIGEVGIVPVVVLDAAADAVPLSSALVAGNLPVAEVTFRTAAAAAALAAMAADPQMLVGAGTVLTTAQADDAIAAGARFIVSPGFSPAVVAHCQGLGVPIFPGVATPSELQQAYEAGLRTVKFFPAEQVGGLSALKAMSQPYGMMRFIPTGGIAAATAADYLAYPAVHAVGGSWMVAKSLVRDGRFDEITRLAAEAVDLVRSTRAAGN